MTTLRVLGIDPGSRLTGYGLIDTDGLKTVYVASGVIRAGSGEISERLRLIFAGVSGLVSEYGPAVIALERVFVHRNADSALKLGQARAAALCATFAADIAVSEYAARAVKQAIVGRGGADKSQVQHMVAALLKLPAAPQADEADALAVALCHAHTSRLAARLAAPVRARGAAR